MSAASNFNSLTGNAMSHQRQAVGQGIQNLQLGPSSITNGAKIHSSISVVGLNVVYKPMETYAGVLGAILQQFGWRVLRSEERRVGKEGESYGATGGATVTKTTR